MTSYYSRYEFKQPHDFDLFAEKKKYEQPKFQIFYLLLNMNWPTALVKPCPQFQTRIVVNE